MDRCFCKHKQILCLTVPPIWNHHGWCWTDLAQGIDSTIGEGGFGTVFKAKPTLEGCKLVAGTIREGRASLGSNMPWEHEWSCPWKLPFWEYTIFRHINLAPLEGMQASSRNDVFLCHNWASAGEALLRCGGFNPTSPMQLGDVKAVLEPWALGLNADTLWDRPSNLMAGVVPEIYGQFS